MNILLYVILFIIFSPKFFILLAGKRTAPVTIGEILLNGFLFVLAVYVAEYFTHKYHVLENYEDTTKKQSFWSFLEDLLPPSQPIIDYTSPPPPSTILQTLTGRTSSL